MSHFRPSIKMVNKPKTTISDIIFPSYIDNTHPLYTRKTNYNLQIKQKINKKTNTFKITSPK
jgi:hypothetical protein